MLEGGTAGRREPSVSRSIVGATPFASAVLPPRCPDSAAARSDGVALGDGRSLGEQILARREIEEVEAGRLHREL